jgi:hypothetical protein
VVWGPEANFPEAIIYYRFCALKQGMISISLRLNIGSEAHRFHVTLLPLRSVQYITAFTDVRIRSYG